MHLVRFRTPQGEVSVGVARGGRVSVIPGSTLAELLRLKLDDLRSVLQDAVGNDFALGDVELLPPIDGRTDVWAAGVTYERSREARVEESDAAADMYVRVYDAARPELFFKSVSWRVVGDGQVVAVRDDSDIDVPEPELALVVNRWGEVVGYSVCDDVSSRSIEGDNPLYLPQAKIYIGACALGPGIRPAWEIADPENLDVRLRIWRSGEQLFDISTSTSLLHRTLAELVDYVFRSEVFPDGVVLSTGTCLVPDDFTLLADDVVEISIAEVGTLTTGVVSGKEAMAWVADGGRPPAWPRPVATSMLLDVEDQR